MSGVAAGIRETDDRRAEAVAGGAVVALVLAVVGLLLVVGSAVGEVSVVPWPAVSVVALVVLSFPVRLSVGSASIAYAAVDALVSAGLLLLRPDELVLAVALATGVRLVLVERQRARHLLANLAVAAVRLLGALLTWTWLTGGGVLDDPGALTSAALAAALVGALAATVLVGCLAVIESGAEFVDAAIGATVRGMGLALGAATLGAILGVQVLDGGTAWWLPVLPLTALIVVTSELARQRDRSRGLVGAMEATRHIQGTAAPGEALRRLLTELEVRFDADGVEFLRVPEDGGPPARISRGDPTAADRRLFEPGGPEGVAQLRPRSGAGPVRRGRGLSLRLRLIDGSIELHVWRSRYRAPYRRTDLEHFQAVCDAAVQSLESSRLSEMLRRLEELDEMKTAFLTAVSHDLRTPLSVLLAGVGTLEAYMDRLPRDQVAEMLARMGAQGRRLDRMLADLLDIDRLERGVIEPRREQVDLAALARGIVDEIADASHPVRVSREPVPAVADAGHVARIVENLVRNAMKYTPPGTAVWVDVRRDASGAQLIVSDAGPGVPETQRQAIFGAFVRGDDAHPSPGTGVGLDLVRRLAELHGGSAWVDERPGGGARFWVTLPDAPDEVIEEVASEAAAG